MNMAEAAIVSKATEYLTSVLVEKLCQEVSLLTSFREDFEFICEELISIKALLKDAGDKRNSSSVSIWLDRLELFLLDAVDTVEECGAGRCKWWNPIFRYKMGRKIRILKERISKIQRRPEYLVSITSVLHVNERMQGFNEYDTQYKRERSNAIISESQTVGMEHQIHDITDLISQENGPQVIAIVGMGGQGKTLLLQHVFNSQKVREDFEHMVWLTVSQKFSVERLLFDIFKQLSKDPKEIKEMEEKIMKKVSNIRRFTDPDDLEREVKQKLRDGISKHLEGKHSLFAIDDVWDQHFLHSITLPLESENKTVKIVITTRDRKVVEQVESHLCHIHSMDGLSPDDSWKLFSIHAFPPNRRESAPEAPKTSAHNVAMKKCAGLPLALKTIGSYLARVGNKDWEFKLRSLPEATDSVMHSLRLSYEALPDRVKPCFLYFSVFSKNTLIQSESLVHAWIAEGFISTSTQEAAEDAYGVGCFYLDELVDLCLVEVSQFDGNGRVKYCKMHDLLHDFAHSESLKQSKCLLETGGDLGELPVERCRLGLHRISLVKNNISKIKDTVQCRGLRTLLLSYNYSLQSISSSFFNSLRYLTVLDLNRTSIRSLPRSIGDLKFLKYLNLSGCPFISMLPKSSSNLRRLEFLDVSYCLKLEKLHSGIGKHKFLLYLNLKGCKRLRSLPVGISKLISLHTLKGARISMSKKAANALQLRDLKGLTLLQQLSLLIVDGDGRANQLEEGIFKGMTKMRILEVFNHNSSILHLPQDMSVMEHLEIVRLHHCKLPEWIFRLENLNELTSCRDDSLDYTGLQKIRNLRKLQLSENKACVEFPEVFGEAGAFPKLRELSIEDFETLKIFHPLKDDAMPSLKYLQITKCDKLEKWPERFEELEGMEEEQDLELCDLPSEIDAYNIAAEGLMVHLHRQQQQQQVQQGLMVYLRRQQQQEVQLLGLPQLRLLRLLPLPPPLPPQQPPQLQ